MGLWVQSEWRHDDGWWSNGPVVLVLALAGVTAFSAFVAVKENGARWSSILLFFGLFPPTLLVVYIVTGLVRNAFNI